MTEERNAFREERDVLRATIQVMQRRSLPVAMRSPSATTFPSQNPWGAIGSGGGRVNMGSRPDTPFDTPSDSPATQPRSFSYAAPGSFAFGTNSALYEPGPTTLNPSGSLSTLNPAAPAYGFAKQNGTPPFP